MNRLAPLLLFTLLAACGMKGALYQPEPLAGPPSATESVPAEPGAATGDEEQDERKSIPAKPDPVRSQ